MDKRTGKKRVLTRRPEDTLGRRPLSMKDAFDQFYQSKSGERLRDVTLRDYRRHYAYFAEWMAATHPGMDQICMVSAAVIREYVYFMSFEKPRFSGHPYRQVDLDRKGLTPGAVNVRINTLKAMFRWFLREGLISVDPTDHMKRQRIEEDRIVAFSDDQVEALLRQVDQRTFAGQRDYVMMRLLLESGMRVGEVVALDKEDVDVKTRLITLSGSKSKNRRLRVVPLSLDMCRLLFEWMTESQSHFPDSEGIFLANYGERLSQTSIRHRIKEYGQQAGLGDQVRCSPHTFRHTFAKNFLIAGGDIIALQRILGHSSMEMVRKYVQHTPDDLRDAHDKFTEHLSQRSARRKRL